jgi:HAD superfamily hydrolase (TIGR01549 family)
MKALIFDLDGTLIDSVYPHTLAWQSALAEFGLEVPAWQIHRRIGLSGRLLVKSLARRQDRELSDATLDALESRQSVLFQEMASMCVPLPGARALLAFLHDAKVPHGIATSGKHSEIEGALKALELRSDVVVVDGDSVARAKPDPDLFLECQQRLSIAVDECLVVGDAVWDVHAARRAGISSTGLLTGGFGRQELYNAGAMRVYEDALDFLRSIDEMALSV